MRPIAFFCKTFRDDFDRLAQMLETFRANNAEGIPLVLSLPEEDVELYRARFAAHLLPVFLDHELTGLRQEPGNGWTYQQVVKLCCDQTFMADNYFMVDSDFYFIRPFRHAEFVDAQGQPFTFFSPHGHYADDGDMLSVALAYIRGAEPSAFTDAAMARLRGGRPPHLGGEHDELRRQAKGTDLSAVFQRAYEPYYCQPGTILRAATLRHIRARPAPGAGVPGSVAAALVGISPWEFNWHSEYLLASDATLAIRPPPVFAIYSQSGFDQVRAAGLTEASFAQRYLALSMAARHFDQFRLDPPSPSFVAGYRLEVVGLPDSGALVAELDSGGGYRRAAPLLVGATEWQAAAVARELRRDPVAPPPARLGMFRDAMVFGPGVVVTADGRVVRESLIHHGRGDVVGALRRIPDAEAFELPHDLAIHRRFGAGNYVLLKQLYDGNYGHWMVDTLPRIELVGERHELRDCRFILSGDAESVHAQSLALLGVAPQAMIFTGHQTMSFERLIYPAPLSVDAWTKSPRAVSFLESLVPLAAGVDYGERIYVSRNTQSRRRLLNEPEIAALLEARGYRVLYPETLSVANQIAAFRRARRIVGNMGAGLTNLVFAGRGVRLFALATAAMLDDFYWDLVSLKDGSYRSLHGAAAHPEQGMNSDFTVDLGVFEDMLRAFEVEE